MAAVTKNQAIVVGGGLAGMSAANTLLENGARVVLLDKSSFCGGNSTKATSGINGAATKTQMAQGIDDSIELFVSDTLKGGAKKPEVAKVLCGNSGVDVDWLVEKFDLDLSLVARLGGHSAPRTHRGKERFPGMTITYALIQMLEKIAERTDLARIITKARVVELLIDPSGACIGCVYEKDQAKLKEYGPVILASGGFGADFTQGSLLAQHRPDLMHLPTSNGDHCTGDGIKMGEQVGAKTIDLEWVQVHPTGLVKPDDPDAKIKFLCAEALRGVGGLVLDANGKRFCNELGRRDYVTGEMWKNKPPFRLILNKKAADEIVWHCKHYTGRGVMRFFASGEELAKEMGIPVSVLEETHNIHYEAAMQTEKNPDGGQYTAYPTGKSWDPVSGATGAGKKFFHNVIPGSQVKTEPFYVAIITPVIHYCMGGLEIDVDSRVLNKKGAPIPGLYAAGEVAGGVHGNNRLGGNSLLDCVVFGRVSGKHCAKYILGENVQSMNLKELSGAIATTNTKDQAIVVGGGLAGMSAANTLLENGARVVLLDKSSFCGGNSTKATSGINGAATKTQKVQGIEDSIELFVSDTLKGGAKKPEVAKVLCGNSGLDVDWLVEKFDLDLSLVARLGGHSAPRTHRGKERFPGMTITYALIQMVEKIAERTDKARIITKAKVFELLTDKNGACIGCKYEKSGSTFEERGPVILASGGFGADFTQQSLLAQYRPDLMHLPTSNGDHCTGDGIKMGEAIGAKTIDLEWVQVHPTGLVKPDDPDAKIKFLCAEALRGVGGLVVDANGNRFCNELGRRDYVTGEMWKNKPPFRLMLNKKASDEIQWHCKHYTGRGVMKFYASGEELAKEMGISLSVLEATHDQHYKAYTMTQQNPDGGPYPAYPSGTSWDEPSGKTGAGKKFYHNVIPGSQVKTEPFYVAIITPVIHYCMGGLEIDVHSRVLGQSGEPVPGLYAAGEVAGGVHGNNRLGGNSLLDCVVFGRVSGKHCAKYLLGERATETSLKELSGGGLTAVAETKPAKESKPAASSSTTVSKGGYTMEEVAKHTTKGDCWVVLHDRVLDVTSFLPNHPGGELAILTFAGKDATAEFDMIHPRDVIEKYAPEAVIGHLGGGGAAEEEDESAALPDGQSAYTMEEIAKHTTKNNCWVVLHNKVLDVTKFLSQHPGGELAILTFAGKDATAEFDMIHPPDVISKYAPDTIIGVVGSAKAKKAVTGAAAAAPSKKDAGSALANHHAWGYFENHDNWRNDALENNPGVFLINVKAYVQAAWTLLLAVLYEVCATIFSTTNIKISNDRKGLTRSAILLVLFIVIHAVGNLHVFKGPDDFNGYGYFYVRLYWTGFGLPANIVEEYILLGVLLHVFVGLKRTWDMKLALVKSTGLGALNLALSGLALLTFMTIHLFQFRFGDTEQFGPYYVRPPPYLINFWGIPSLNLFWTDDASVQPVGVRDIYALEFQVFQSKFWSLFYILSVGIFCYHACVGWKKVTPVLGIPKGHIAKVEMLGTAIFVIIGLIYISFPLYVNLTSPFPGYERDIQVPSNRLGA